MATEKRLIDANALQRLLLPIAMGLEKEYGSLGGAVSGVMMHIDNAPIVDAVEVVRCEDCKHSKLPGFVTLHYGLPGTLTCTNRNSPCNNRHTLGEGYCPYGEKKDGN